MLTIASTVRKTAPGAASPLPAAMLRLEPIAPAELDASLVRLARLEARSRLVLGRAAARFVEIRGYDRLGFRLADYARERLGISGRELSSFAFVASRLAERPRLAAAFARGEISWSKARLLCAVATADTEEIWFDRAREATVAELATAIRGERGSVQDASEVGDTLDEESDSIEGEPRARFALRCPARVTVLWRRALETARRMLGSQAPVWQAAEAIAAEASSAEPGLVAGAEHQPIEDATADASGAALVLKVPPAALEAWCDDDDRFEDCDAFELDGEMLRLIAVLHEIDARLGHALRRFSDLRTHRELGFASFDLYVRERLGISPAKARTLVLLDRRSRELAELGRAYRSGELSWVRALAILPVARRAQERAWVVRAGEVMVRRLVDEVEWALDRRDAYGADVLPPEHGARLERPDLQICARSESETMDRRVTFFGPASVIGLFRAAVVTLSGPNEPYWKGLERLLLHAVTQWESEPRHRDPIFARDGWRCGVPGCTARRSLEDHHITWRSHGGGNEPENRVACCAAHHHHAIHRGTIRASGRAPSDIRWELGVSPGRAPLLVLDGERYVHPFAL